MTGQLRGVVNQVVMAREGKSFEDEDVVELRFLCAQDEKTQQTTTVLVDRESAKDLAYWLIDMFLYPKGED